jgi:hypothetical protein
MASFKMRGSGGRLLCGSRTVAEFGAWHAGSHDGKLRVSAPAFEPDPYWYDHHDASRLVAELEVGKGTWQGRAEIVAKEPLMFLMEVE